MNGLFIIGKTQYDTKQILNHILSKTTPSNSIEYKVQCNLEKYDQNNYDKIITFDNGKMNYTKVKIDSFYNIVNKNKFIENKIDDHVKCSQIINSLIMHKNNLKNLIIFRGDNIINDDILNTLNNNNINWIVIIYNQYSFEKNACIKTSLLKYGSILKNKEKSHNKYIIYNYISVQNNSKKIIIYSMTSVGINNLLNTLLYDPMDINYHSSKVKFIKINMNISMPNIYYKEYDRIFKDSYYIKIKNKNNLVLDIYGDYDKVYEKHYFFNTNQNKNLNIVHNINSLKSALNYTKTLDINNVDLIYITTAHDEFTEICKYFNHSYEYSDKEKAFIYKNNIDTPITDFINIVNKMEPQKISIKKSIKKKYDYSSSESDSDSDEKPAIKNPATKKPIKKKYDYSSSESDSDSYIGSYKESDSESDNDLSKGSDSESINESDNKLDNHEDYKKYSGFAKIMKSIIKQENPSWGVVPITKVCLQRWKESPFCKIHNPNKLTIEEFKNKYPLFFNNKADINKTTKLDKPNIQTSYVEFVKKTVNVLKEKNPYWDHKKIYGEAAMMWKTAPENPKTKNIVVNKNKLPTKEPSKFNIFVKNNVKIIKQKHPDWDHKQIFKKIHEIWQTSPENSNAKYVILTQEEHKDKYPKLYGLDKDSIVNEKNIDVINIVDSDILEI
jgi:hypothetical protein